MKTSEFGSSRAEVVRSYAELSAIARAFAKGHLNFLLLAGRGGLGKSRQFREALGDQACWIGGNATPFGIYCAAYRYADRPLVLDDVDALHRQRDGVRLLKSLCQSEKVKHVGWHSSPQGLETMSIPAQFTTTSRVAILANDWQARNADVAALEDRAHRYLFDPCPEEIHRHASTWFWDQEIFDFVGQHLHLVKQHSLRLYGRIWEKKQAGLDWRASVLAESLSGKTLEVAPLKADPSYTKEGDRVLAFIAAGNGSRATYFNHAKRLRPSVQAPLIRLLHNRPPAEEAGDSDLLDVLRRQYHEVGRG